MDANRANNAEVDKNNEDTIIANNEQQRQRQTRPLSKHKIENETVSLRDMFIDQQMSEIFDGFEDYYITSSEFRTILSQKCVGEARLSDEEIDEMMRELDLDSDGPTDFRKIVRFMLMDSDDNGDDCAMLK